MSPLRRNERAAFCFNYGARQRDKQAQGGGLWPARAGGMFGGVGTGRRSVGRDHGRRAGKIRLAPLGADQPERAGRAAAAIDGRATAAAPPPPPAELARRLEREGEGISAADLVIPPSQTEGTIVVNVARAVRIGPREILVTATSGTTKAEARFQLTVPPAVSWRELLVTAAWTGLLALGLSLALVRPVPPPPPPKKKS